jgi:hypothetical protein
MTDWKLSQTIPKRDAGGDLIGLTAVWVNLLTGEHRTVQLDWRDVRYVREVP